MYYHVWFLTKYREAILKGSTEKVAKNILAKCFKRHKYNVLEFETNRDHVHMLVEASDRKKTWQVLLEPSKPYLPRN